MRPPEQTTDGAGSPAGNGLVRIVYQLLFALLLILATPVLVLKMVRRGQWRTGFGQRFGFFSKELVGRLAGSENVWLNAVSVGEVNLTIQLVTRLKKRLPNATLVVSTTTTTGMAELQKKLPDDVIKIYYPIDLGSAVRRTLKTLQPRAIVLIEADFWPNLLWEARAEGVPVMLVNALISQRSARGYRRFGLLFRPLFASFDRVFCADTVDRERLEELGCRPERLEVVGHPKFDTAFDQGGDPLNVRALLGDLGLASDQPILLGGSTHAPEEVLLARTYLKLRSIAPGLFLILVPRHFERASEVARDLGALGIRVILRSDLPRTAVDPRSEPACLIVDTTGELRDFYREADIVFVGQSFVEGGGQNPIEPAVHGRAIVTGPKMETFKAILPAFLKERAMVQVEDIDGLERACRGLLSRPDDREAMGKRARQVVDQNQGALDRTADGIVARLENPPARRERAVL